MVRLIIVLKTSQAALKALQEASEHLPAARPYGGLSVTTYSTLSCIAHDGLTGFLPAVACSSWGMPLTLRSCGPSRETALVNCSETATGDRLGIQACGKLECADLTSQLRLASRQTELPALEQEAGLCT